MVSEDPCERVLSDTPKGVVTHKLRTPGIEAMWDSRDPSFPAEVTGLGNIGVAGTFGFPRGSMLSI